MGSRLVIELTCDGCAKKAHVVPNHGSRGAHLPRDWGAEYCFPDKNGKNVVTMQLCASCKQQFNKERRSYKKLGVTSETVWDFHVWLVKVWGDPKIVARIFRENTSEM